MKITLIALVLLFSQTALSEVFDLRIVKRGEYTPYLKKGFQKIHLGRNASIRNNSFIVTLPATSEIHELAHLDQEESSEGFFISKDSVQVNILVNKKERNLDRGFYPPNLLFLIEVETMQGQILCFNQNVLLNRPDWFKGKCL